MMDLCEVCGSKMDKGKEKHPLVVANICSALCFRIFIRTYSGPYLSRRRVGLIPNLLWVGQKNFLYKSSWEEKFAEFLREEGYEFDYEPIIFHEGKVLYLPDFLIHNLKKKGSIFVEIKGRWEPGAYEKVTTMKNTLPKIPLLVFNEKIMKEVMR